MLSVLTGQVCGWVTNTNRCARLAAMRLRSFRPGSPSGTATSPCTRSSRRSRSARYCFQCAVDQPLSSSSDGDGAQQQSLERCTEGSIATLDGIARITQQMRQAHLPLHGVKPRWLPSISETQTLGLDGPEQVGHHGLAAAGANNVQHRPACR